MESKATTTKSIDLTEKSGKANLELFKLKLVGHSAKVVSSLTSKLTFIVVVAFFSLFFILGLCLYLGYFYFQLYTAFFILASLFLFFALLFIITKGEIVKGPMKYLIINSLLKEMDRNTIDNNKKKKVLFDNY